MSEQSGGPGWWIASDGKWYPPETAPSVQPPPPPTAPGAPANAVPDDEPGLAKRTWTKYRAWPLWAQIALGLVLLGLILAPFSSDSDPEDASASNQTTTTADATTTTVVEETTTTEPPTTTTTAAPTTTTLPAPVAYSGSGSQVVAIEKPGELVFATITNRGGSNFAVWALDSGLEQVDLLVNEIGDYTGSVLLDTDGTTTTALEITSSGSWTVELKVIELAREFDASIDGTGDDVVLYSGDTGIAQVANQGDSNFAIWHHNADGSDLIINEIGPIEGGYRWPSGFAAIEITATGPWQIAVT